MLSKDIFRYPSGLGCIVLSLVLSSSSLLAQTAPPALGLFQDYAEVGALQRAGSARYDSAHHVYTVTASGDSIGSTSDAFHLLSKQVSGEIALTADIDLPEKSRHPQGIAVLMIRQSLDADSVFAAVALSGEGLASMQFRDAKGSITRKIESNLAAPRRLRIEKRGDFIYVFLASAAGGPLRSLNQAFAPRLLLRWTRRLFSRQKRRRESHFLERRPRNSRRKCCAACPLQHP
jgi:TolB protein